MARPRSWASARPLHQQLIAPGCCLASIVGIVAYQWLCAAYLFLLASVYWLVDLADMTYYSNLLAPPTTRRLTLWGNLHLAVAVLHVVDTMTLLLSSFFSCQPQANRGVDDFIGACIACGLPWRRLEIESSAVEAFLALRLYKYSILLSRPWINNVLVAMFVLDCWDSAILSWWLRGSDALRRVVALAVDTALVIGTNVVIPAIIFIPYAIEFDKEMFTFPARRLYIDELFMEMITENRSVLALSTTDGLSKIVPHFSIFTTLTCLRPMTMTLRLLHSYASDSRIDVDGADRLPAWLLFVRQRDAETFQLTALLAAQDATSLAMHDVVMSTPAIEQHIEDLGIEVDLAAFVKLLVSTLSDRKAVDVQCTSAEGASHVDVVLTYRFSDSISRKGRIRVPCVSTSVPLPLVTLLLDLHETKNVPVLTDLQQLHARGPSPTKGSASLARPTASAEPQSSQNDAVAPSTSAMLSKKRHLPIGTARRKGPKGAKLSKTS
ncbi:hypothetical protein P43SY_006790 [Pythium insidiosum]|uniref:Transmembrane protein n=1 Tax=Pythium insidiosum TaxID=114742 RepID=A0AAD5LIA0_PYTIN|nr:hypothetical protein P43SY_006790 [Pythium insidiosum]